MDFWAIYTGTAEGVCPWVHRIVIEGCVLVFMCLVLFMQQARHKALVQREERLHDKMRKREEEFQEKRVRFNIKKSHEYNEIDRTRIHANQELQQTKETNEQYKRESDELEEKLSKTERLLTIRSKEYEMLTAFVAHFEIRIEKIEQTMEDVCNMLKECWDNALTFEKQVLGNLFHLQKIKALVNHDFLGKIVHVKRTFKDTTQFSFRNRVKKQCTIYRNSLVMNPVETSLALMNLGASEDPTLGSLSLSDPNGYV